FHIVSISQGPMKSSSSTCGKIRMPAFMVWIVRRRRRRSRTFTPIRRVARASCHHPPMELAMSVPAASPSQPFSCAALRRRFLLPAGAAAALAGGGVPRPAAAIGHGLVDVEIVDRETGQVLETYRHGGRWYVAGRPGARYAIRITNRTGA